MTSALNLVEPLYGKVLEDISLKYNIKIVRSGIRESISSHGYYCWFTVDGFMREEDFCITYHAINPPSLAEQMFDMVDNCVSDYILLTNLPLKLV